MPIDGSSYQNGITLRYKRRSSVYSKRTLDGVIQQDSVTPPQPKAEPRLRNPTVVKTPQQSSPQALNPMSFDLLSGKTRSKPVAVPSLPRQQYRIQQQAPLEQTVEPKLTWKQRLLTRNNLLMAMASFVFVFGIGVSAYSLLTNKHVTQQVQALNDSTKSDDNGTSGDEKPDETPLHANAVSSYKAAPDYPRKITIKKISVAARVKPLGVSGDNQLLAPSSIYDAGWYTSSAKPGVDAGAVLIDGHVHGPTKPGIFANLKKLVPGDTIQIERGDGRVVTYRVEKTSQAAADTLDMAALMTSVQPGKQGLNIVTCGGKYDAKTGHYESRDQVFAVEVD